MDKKILTYFSSITLCLLILSVFLIVSVSALPSTDSWSETNLTNTTAADSWFADAEVEEEDGTLHFTWLEQVGSYYQIFYNYRTAGGTLGVAKQLTFTSVDRIGHLPRIAVAPNGDVVVVWSEYSTSYGQAIYMRKTTGGTWESTPQLVNGPDDPANTLYVDPDVAFNSLNQFFIVFTAKYYSSGFWQGSDVVSAGNPPQIIVNTISGSLRVADAFAPRIVCQGNYLHLAYSYRWKEMGVWGQAYLVSYKNYDFGSSSWSGEYPISNDPTGWADYSAIRPDIAVSSSGTPVFTYRVADVGYEDLPFSELHVRIGTGSGVHGQVADNLYSSFGYGHSVNVRSNGNVLIAWVAGSSASSALYCAEVTVSGDYVGYNPVLSNFVQENPVMLVYGANAMIVYEDYTLGGSAGELYLVNEAQPALKVATPTFNPTGGRFTNTLDVTISCSTPSVIIRYTTDGSTPTPTHGTPISSGQTITLSSTTTLKAMAYRSGYTDSNIATATYTKSVYVPQVATPIFSPEAGTYSGARTVHILVATSGATIRYTTDGSTPTSTYGTIYSGAIWVSSSMTIKAIAYQTGYFASFGTATYTILPQVATPTFSPPGGTYTSAQSVTISCATSGATIRYTTDGSTPTPTHGTIYSGPVSVTSSMTLKAMAYRSGYMDSNVASATYTIMPKVATPTFSPPGGTYTSAQSVTISSTTPSPTIRYTTDGSTPTSSYGTIYSGPITVSSSMTLKAIAYKSGYTDSNIATATYTINIPSDDTPPTGSIIINGGDLYTSSTSVTLTLTYSDDLSGVKDVRYANTGDPSWSDWEAPSPTKSWTLRSEDGYKVVIYQIRDYADNTANYYGYITYDATPPGAFTVSSSTHPDQDAWYSSSDPSFTWTIPTDSSGIAGYSIGISPYSFGIPDQIIDTTDNSFSYTDVEDGQWYFIVRAVDNAGNWGYIANYRFKIDTTSEMETLYFDVSFEDEVYVVETFSNSSVTDLVFSQAAKRLMFSVEGSDGTVGVCDITFPADLLSGAFTVYMDDTQLVEGVDYTGSYNATHHTISINYEHSSHVIEVFGTHVVPDFAAWLFIPFLMTATLLGLAFRKRLKKPNHLV